MTYTCDDNEVLWIAGINEPATIEQINEACNYGQSWLINLTDPNGFCLLQRFTPTPGIPDTPHQNIAERMAIGYQGDNANVIKHRLRLDDHICAIVEWHRKQWLNNSIWLYHMISGESGLRRSLLYGVTPVDNIREVGKGGIPTTLHTQLSMDRHWCWETPEAIEYAIGARPVWGDVVNLNYEIGTANGRICRFQVRDRATSVTVGDDIIQDIWIGIQEDNGCGLDQWQPDMDLNQGFTAFTDSNTIVNTLSGGELAAVEDFALSTARIKRIGIELFQAFPGLTPAEYDQWRGQYIVLLRARVDDAATIVTVQADSGWRTTRLKNYIGKPETINGANGTDYRLVNLGIATIPEDMHRLCANDTLGALPYDILDNYSIGLEFGRDAGLGNFAMTDLYLIPYTHSAIISNLNPDSEFINFQNMWFTVITNEDDTQQLRSYTQRNIPPLLTSPDNDFTFDVNDFSMPKKGGRIVAGINIYDQTTNSIINDKTFLWSFEADVFPRWLSYRHDG